MIILVTIAAISLVYAFVLEWRRSSAFARLLSWLRTERAENWDALSRADRLLSIKAVEILRRGPLSDDDEFQGQYRASKHGRQFAVSMSLGFISIVLAVIGTQVFDWDW